MNIFKDPISLKDRDKSKQLNLNLRKKSILSKIEKEKTKPKLVNNIKENSEEKENNKINTNQKLKQNVKIYTNQKIKQNKNQKTKRMKNKSNQNLSKESSIKLTNLSSFKFKSKNKSPEKNYSSYNLENLLINVKINENKNNIIEKDEYREMFSKYVRDDYSNSILESLFKDDYIRENFLEFHKITPRMRTRMADWMIEVLSNYNCDDLTYFESINLMDRYFLECEKINIVLIPEDLHLIGVTCMFIASKYHDIRPLRLKTVQEKIAHGKLTCEEIKNKEDEISRFLNYSFGLPSIWDFITIFIEEIFYVKYNSHQIQNKILLENYCKENYDKNDENDIKLGELMNKLYTKNMLNLLKIVCLYLAKMNCHDYILMQNKQSLLAASTIFVAMKICEKINDEEYINDYFNNKLSNISNQDENNIIPIAQKILYNAQHFDEIFNGLENLKKVHFNAIIELKNTK